MMLLRRVRHCGFVDLRYGLSIDDVLHYYFDINLDVCPTGLPAVYPCQ